MSPLSVTLRTLYLRLRYRRIRFGTGCVSPMRLRIRGKGRIVIGRHLHLPNLAGRPALLPLEPSARIATGDRVDIDGAGIMAANAIVIEADAILGPCLLVDTDFHAIGPPRRRGGAAVDHAPIRIG